MLYVMRQWLLFFHCDNSIRNKNITITNIKNVDNFSRTHSFTNNIAESN